MKRKEQLNEYRGKDTDALKKQVEDLKHEMMNLNFKKASGQLTHSSRIREIRRSVARINTVLRQQVS